MESSFSAPLVKQHGTPEQDVLDGLDALGFAPTEFQAISTRSSSGRQAWRAVLADGSKVKVRRRKDEQQADRVVEILANLDVEGFARVLGRWRRVTVEEWIEGSTLEYPTRSEVVQAAILLRRLHDSRPVQMESTAPHLEGVICKLPLAGLEVLETPLRELAPAECLWGLIHGDFCGNNLVRDTMQGIWCIDNEWQGTGPILYDLARTLTLWDFDEEQEACFLHAYYGKDQAVSPGFFWTASALVESIHNRRKRGMASVEIPERRLELLLKRFKTSQQSW